MGQHDRPRVCDESAKDVIPDKEFENMIYIGIDISKATFVAAIPQGKSYRTETFSNNVKGIRRFISKLDPAIHQCVMEATGNYCFLLLYLLDKGASRQA